MKEDNVNGKRTCYNLARIPGFTDKPAINEDDWVDIAKALSYALTMKDIESLSSNWTTLTPAKRKALHAIEETKKGKENAFGNKSARK